MPGSKLEVYQEFISRSKFDVDILKSYGQINVSEESEIEKLKTAKINKDALVVTLENLKVAIANNQEADADELFTQLEKIFKKFKESDLALSDETRSKIRIVRMAIFQPHPASLEDLLGKYGRELRKLGQEVKKVDSERNFSTEANEFVATALSDNTRQLINSDNYVDRLMGTNPHFQTQQKEILKKVLLTLTAINEGDSNINMHDLSKQISSLDSKTLHAIKRNSQSTELLKIFLVIEMLPYMQAKTKEVQDEKGSFFTTVAHLFQPKTSSEKKEDAITKLFDYFTKPELQNNFKAEDVKSLQEKESRVQNIISRYSSMDVLPPSIDHGVERPSP